MVNRVNPNAELRRKADSAYSQRIRRSWLVRTLSFLLLVEHVVATGIERLPVSVRPFVKAQAEAFGAPIGHLLGSRIGRSIAMMNVEAPGIPEVNQLIQRITSVDARNKVGGTLISAFMGRYVNIVEVFDSSTEWCVD